MRIINGLHLNNPRGDISGGLTAAVVSIIPRLFPALNRIFPFPLLAPILLVMVLGGLPCIGYF